MKHIKQQGSKDTDELDNDEDHEDLFAEIGNYTLLIKPPTRHSQADKLI